jgi:hypothetical protein
MADWRGAPVAVAESAHSWRGEPSYFRTFCLKYDCPILARVLVTSGTAYIALDLTIFQLC